MRRHCPDDVAHLPRRLHHPSGDVALQRCWSAVCVVGVVSGRLWLGTAMGVSGWRRRWRVAEATVVGVGDGGGWKKALFVC